MKPEGSFPSNVAPSDPDAAGTANDGLVGSAGEEGRSDDARAREQAGVQVYRIGHPIEPAVQDVVPLVRHEGLAIGLLRGITASLVVGT